MRRAEVVRGLEPLAGVDVNHAKKLHTHFEEVCSMPTLWERSFEELLGCFKTPEAAMKAFRVLDTDNNGLVDARELLGALSVMSSGHLTERMTLLFDIFDCNGEKEMAFDECFLMIRRTLVGLRKMVGIHTPPEKVIHNMTKQVWRLARKHREDRITHSDWYTWWSADASCRNGLKMFVWKPEEQRGLPTPDHYMNVDYTKAVNDTLIEAATPGAKPGRPSSRASLLAPHERGSTPSTLSPFAAAGAASLGAGPRRASFSASMDREGNISRPKHDEAAGVPTARTMSKLHALAVP